MTNKIESGKSRAVTTSEGIRRLFAQGFRVHLHGTEEEPHKPIRATMERVQAVPIDVATIREMEEAGTLKKSISGGYVLPEKK